MPHRNDPKPLTPYLWVCPKLGCGYRTRSAKDSDRHQQMHDRQRRTKH